MKMNKQEKQLIIFDRHIPASSISEEAGSVAQWLTDRGIRGNDMIALLMWNDVQFFSISEACELIGARLVLLNWHLTRPELEYILADSGSKVLIGHSPLLAQADLRGNEDLKVVAMSPAPELIRLFPKVSEEGHDNRGWISSLLLATPVRGAVADETVFSIRAGRPESRKVWCGRSRPMTSPALGASGLRRELGWIARRRVK
jgi:acyl-coenzyme A synthetase/AMP-(fatty) acid ligase